jgi:hypothetical protein
MPQDTSNKNGSSPQRRNGTTFLIPDITLRPEGIHLCSENYKPFHGSARQNLADALAHSKEQDFSSYGTMKEG